MEAITVQKLIKRYSTGVVALDNLDLSVKQGEIFTLLGPNGAGKSTLIHILTTYLRATSGQVTILGLNPFDRRDLYTIRSRIACVAQSPAIDAHLSLIENMQFHSRLYRINQTTARERIRQLIDAFDLSAYLRYPVASYSGGVKRRLDIAMNLVSNPQILFLDEPTVGMDVRSRLSMWETVNQIRENFKTTIFLTTHSLEEASQLSDTICILKAGRSIIQDTPARLRCFTRSKILRVSFLDPLTARNSGQALTQANLLCNIRVQENKITSDIGDQGRTAVDQVARWLLDQSIPFDALELTDPSLEDVFLKITAAGERL